jgi:hypothetical protein
MTILLPALAVAFAAFCVWLGVRIVNRRERWAKWTAGLVALTAFVLYPLSLPWVTSYLTLRDVTAERRVHLVPLYAPLTRLFESCPDVTTYQYVAYCYWVEEFTGAMDHKRRRMNKT